MSRKSSKGFDSPEGDAVVTETDDTAFDPTASALEGESLPVAEPEPAPAPPPGPDESKDVLGRPVDEQTPPLAGPKATDVPGIAAAPTTPEIRHPELESPKPAPLVYEAPPAPDQVERESWGERPTLDELRTAEVVKVRTVDEQSVGIYVGGIQVFRWETEVAVQAVRDRGESHLRALASDLAIEVQLVK